VRRTASSGESLLAWEKDAWRHSKGSTAKEDKGKKHSGAAVRKLETSKKEKTIKGLLRGWHLSGQRRSHCEACNPDQGKL